jgi:cell division protein FtsI (penicillin-binding protein 3)
MLRRFGFGERSGSGFPDESAGLLRNVDGWRPVDAATAAFGQGLNTTPIQLAAAMSAIANGGELVTPRLVSARRARVGGWIPTRREVRRRVLDPEVAAQTLAMLQGVVSPEGTGSRAGLRNVRVAGKTGTAQKVDPATRAYSSDRYLAWFIGTAPADAPRIVIVAGIDEARWPYHTGGYAAAPLFAAVAAAELNRIGIPTAPEAVRAPKAAQIADEAPPVDLPEVSAPPKRAAPAVKARSEAKKITERVRMPDLRGLTVAEVRSVTDRQRLELKISGSGRAIAQDPSPGTVVERSARPAVLRVRFAPSGEGAG